MLAVFACSCGENNPNPEPDPKTDSGSDGATLWTTTFDKSRAFAKSTVPFDQSSPQSPNAVRFTDETFQTVDGFGLAITQASCYNLLKMSQEDRTKLLTELFSPSSSTRLSPVTR